MNYWHAESTNLAECHQPLFDFIANLAENGKETAKINYGIDQGWCAHHNSDIWAKTSPPGGYEWDPAKPGTMGMLAYERRVVKSSLLGTLPVYRR